MTGQLLQLSTVYTTIITFKHIFNSYTQLFNFIIKHNVQAMAPMKKAAQVAVQFVIMQQRYQAYNNKKTSCTICMQKSVCSERPVFHKY